MDISRIVLIIMAVFMMAGAIDKAVFKNRFGYCEQFDEGMAAMGPMATAMVGFMCLAPVLGRMLTPIVTPMFEMFGADPAMLAGSILAMDMGGFPLAMEMTDNQQMAVFSGGLYGGMMGVTLTFAIPVALGILAPEDQPYLAKGVMSGIIVIPAACFVGGLTMGLPLEVIIRNLIPAIILAALLAVGLIFIPDTLMKCFNVFSRLITIMMYGSLAAAIFHELTGIVLIPGMAPIGPQLEIVGIIGITLAGAYPFVHFVTKTFRKPLEKFGSILNVNDVTIGGMIACLANSLPLLGFVKNMNPRGKVAAIAFMVPAAFAFGDHLAYAYANMPEYITSMLVTKLFGGVLAVGVALLLTSNASEPAVEKELSPHKKEVSIG